MAFMGWGMETFGFHKDFGDSNDKGTFPRATRPCGWIDMTTNAISENDGPEEWKWTVFNMQMKLTTLHTWTCDWVILFMFHSAFSLEDVGVRFPKEEEDLFMFFKYVM